MKIKIEGNSVSLSIEGTFSPEELLQLLHEIGAAREQVANDPGTPSANHAEMLCAVDPRYWTELSSDGGSFLGLLYPRFGWLGFLLPHHEVVRLHEVLGNQLAATAAGASTGAGGDAPIH
jgi:hypothetical protein